jgi:hypothetical protein
MMFGEPDGDLDRFGHHLRRRSQPIRIIRFYRRPYNVLLTHMSTNLPQPNSPAARKWKLPALFAFLLGGAGLAAFLAIPTDDNGISVEIDSHDPGVANANPEDLTNGNWESEQIADVADAQLTILVKLLNHPKNLSSDAVADLISDSVQTTALRPAEFDERFKTSSLTIRHGVNLTSNSLATGRTQFVDALAKMSTPLIEASHIHSKFKIISVDMPSATEIRTDVLFQRAGDLPDGSFQQDATWNCVWKPASDGDSKSQLRLQKVSLAAYEEAEQTSLQSHIFSDCTESIFRSEPSFKKQLMPGVDYWRSLTQKQYGVFPFGHHGIAVGDVNGDGLDDLYAGQPEGLPNRLYLQNMDGTVSDVAARAEVDLLNRTRGVLLVDIDDDGDQDLVAVVDQVILFMANDGDANFTETAAVPTTEPGALSAADYDLDGDLDIYVVNYGDRILSSPDVYHDANNGGANVLLRNDGDWNFVDATIESGLDENNHRWSFAASWEDFDDDGDLDLYVANDFGRNNLYQNNDGRFSDVASKVGVEDIAAGMSASWADFDHDSRMDLYVGNMFSSAGLRITGQSRFQKRATSTVRDDFRRHARGNTLFRNTGSGNFDDVSVEAGVTIGRWAWASKFVDINNDSWEDLVVANGFVTGHETKDL